MRVLTRSNWMIGMDAFSQREQTSMATLAAILDLLGSNAPVFSWKRTYWYALWTSAFVGSLDTGSWDGAPKIGQPTDCQVCLVDMISWDQVGLVVGTAELGPDGSNLRMNLWFGKHLRRRRLLVVVETLLKYDVVALRTGERKSEMPRSSVTKKQIVPNLDIRILFEFEIQTLNLNLKCYWNTLVGGAAPTNLINTLVNGLRTLWMPQKRAVQLTRAIRREVFIQWHLNFLVPILDRDLVRINIFWFFWNFACK